VRTHLDKICQIGLKSALVEKCWLAASSVTCKLGLAVAVGSLQLHVHSVIFIPYLRPLSTEVYFKNCITKPYIPLMTSVFLRFMKGCRGGAFGCQHHFPFYV